MSCSHGQRSVHRQPLRADPNLLAVIRWQALATFNHPPRCAPDTMEEQLFQTCAHHELTMDCVSMMARHSRPQLRLTMSSMTSLCSYTIFMAADWQSTVMTMLGNVGRCNRASMHSCKLCLACTHRG